MLSLFLFPLDPLVLAYGTCLLFMARHGLSPGMVPGPAGTYFASGMHAPLADGTYNARIYLLDENLAPLAQQTFESPYSTRLGLHRGFQRIAGQGRRRGAPPLG